MKIHFYIYGLFILLLSAGCTEETDESVSVPEVPGGEVYDVPEGYFVVTFSDLLAGTRAVNGRDPRVQYLHYLLYNSAGAFVKERIVLSPSDTIAAWPQKSVRDTLPKGSYRAVFLANTEKVLFPYPTKSEPVNYSDVLVNYKGNYSDARIMLPMGQFTDKNEYYWANVSFSDANPTPPVLLQRTIGMLNVHRNVVDASKALDSLVLNIVTEMRYKNLIQTTANGVLSTGIRNALNTVNLLGLNVDNVLNPILNQLIVPVVDTLYNRLLKQLVHDVGTALTGNADQQGALRDLGEILNPWENSQAYTAVVDMRNFPKSMDLGLNVKEFYTGTQHFRFDFNTDAHYAQKCIYIKGLPGTYDIRKINVIKKGLLSGVVFDGVVDGFVLQGTFIDITDPLSNLTPGNKRFKADYSLVDIELKSYEEQEGHRPLTLQVRVGDVANVSGILNNVLNTFPILRPTLGLLVGALLSPISNIVVTVPFNLPLLGIENLKISGRWNTPQAY